MQRLQSDDSAEKHLKAAGYHRRRCHLKRAEPFFVNLFNEIDEPIKSLITKKRELEDEENKLIELGAELDATEIILEDAIRDVKDDLGKLDRKSPELNAERKVFPDGLEGVIGRERERQLETLSPFMTRLDALKSHQSVQTAIPLINKAIQDFEQALDNYKAGEKEVQKVQEQERGLRDEIREQLQAAHGSLQNFYKKRPSLAERFFMRTPRAGSSALARSEERGRLKGKIESILSILASRSFVLEDVDRAKLWRIIYIEAAETLLELALTVTDLASFLEVLNDFPEGAFAKEKKTKK